MTYICIGILFFLFKMILSETSSFKKNPPEASSSGGIYHLLFSFVSAGDVIQEMLEICDYIWRRYDFCHLAEAAEPTIELITDCNFSVHNKVTFSIRAVGNICASTEAVNHCVQKVIGEPQTHAFLCTAEHSKMLLCITLHVDFGELHIALSWLV